MEENEVIAFFATTTKRNCCIFCNSLKAENPLSLTKINLHQRFTAVPFFFLPVNTHTLCFTAHGHQHIAGWHYADS